MKKWLLLGIAMMLVLAACSSQQPETPSEMDNTPADDVSENQDMTDYEDVTELSISSPAFTDGGFLPVKYTCDGMDINPGLRVNNPLHRAESLAIIVVDPDTASGDFIHWVIWNIDPIEVIPEDTAPGVEGLNDFGEVSYGGPCPPGSEPHRYFFQVYALNTTLDLSRGATKADLVEAMQGHVIAKGDIVARHVRG